jgi:hypothetical protein
MTSRQLTALGRRCMKRLDMSEWIKHAIFRVVRLEGNVGEATWHPEERRCWIAVEPNEDEVVMVETVIHEILHVLFEGHLPVKGEEEYDEAYEFALNRAAKAYRKAWGE